MGKYSRSNWGKPYWEPGTGCVVSLLVGVATAFAWTYNMMVVAT